MMTSLCGLLVGRSRNPPLSTLPVIVTDGLGALGSSSLALFSFEDALGAVTQDAVTPFTFSESEAPQLANGVDVASFAFIDEVGVARGGRVHLFSTIDAAPPEPVQSPGNDFDLRAAAVSNDFNLTFT